MSIYNYLLRSHPQAVPPFLQHKKWLCFKLWATNICHTEVCELKFLSKIPASLFSNCFARASIMKLPNTQKCLGWNQAWFHNWKIEDWEQQVLCPLKPFSTERTETLIIGSCHLLDIGQGCYWTRKNHFCLW